MSRPIIVIKVGGSLFDWPELPSRLAEFLARADLAASHPLLIAGGGRFVEALRNLDTTHRFGEPTAHALALHAMDLTARVLARIGRHSRFHVVESLKGAARRWQSGDVPVLAPRQELARDERRDSPLPHDWTVTSDSIAARIATIAGAGRLILLKSSELPVDSNRAEAAVQGLVDPHFPSASAAIAAVHLVNLRSEHHANLSDP